MASTTYKPRSSRPMPAQGLSAAEQIEPSFESPIITLISGNDDNVKLQIRYGEITGIFGNAGCGKSLLGLHVVTTHLLTHPTSHAAWIDTVGAFSPGFLKGIVEEKIMSARTEAERQGDVMEGTLRAEEEVARMVEGVLDRVWVMRAFDWWGVAEAVGEVRGHVEANVEAQTDDTGGREQQGAEVEMGVGCEEAGGETVEKEEDREGIIERTWGMGVAEVDNPIPISLPSSPPLPPAARSPSPLESSPLSSPPPSSQLVPPSPTFPQSLALPLPPTLTRSRTEIPDSEAESDEGIISSLSSSPPIHRTPPPPLYPASEASQSSLDLPTQSPSRENPHFRDEVSASAGEKVGRGDEEVSEGKGQYLGGEIHMLQHLPSQDNQTYTHDQGSVANIDFATSSRAHQLTLPSSSQTDQCRTNLKVPVIGVLVIDTITHPVESLLTRAAASAGIAAGGKVDGALALLEKFFGSLTEFVHQRGISVMLLNNALTAPQYRPPPSNPTWQPMEVIPAVGPMLQHVLDTSILLSRGGGGGESGTGSRRSYYNYRSRGILGDVQHGNAQIEVEFQVVHDRNGECMGNTGKVALGVGL